MVSTALPASTSHWHLTSGGTVNFPGDVAGLIAGEEDEDRGNFSGVVHQDDGAKRIDGFPGYSRGYGMLSNVRWKQYSCFLFASQSVEGCSSEARASERRDVRPSRSRWSSAGCAVSQGSLLLNSVSRGSPFAGKGNSTEAHKDHKKALRHSGMTPSCLIMLRPSIRIRLSVILPATTRSTTIPLTVICLPVAGTPKNSPR
jgi:hypothetical protein